MISPNKENDSSPDDKGFEVKRSIGWRKYGGTFGLLTGYIVVGVYPALVANMNPIPKEEELTWIHGKIIVAKDLQPNLTIELDSGVQKNFDFPVNLYLSSVKGSPRFLGIKATKLKELRGCPVDLGTKKLTWTISDQAYVWVVKSSCFNFTYPQAVSYFNKFGKFNWIGAIFHLFCITFLVFTALFERKKK